MGLVEKTRVKSCQHNLVTRLDKVVVRNRKELPVYMCLITGCMKQITIPNGYLLKFYEKYKTEHVKDVWKKKGYEVDDRG